MYNDCRVYADNNSGELGQHLFQQPESANVQLPGPGPLVGNWNVVTQEAACAAAQKNPPWYPTLLSYEAADIGRSHCYPVHSSPGQ